MPVSFMQKRLYSAFARSSAQKLKPVSLRRGNQRFLQKRGPRKAPLGIIRNAKGPDCRAFH